MFLHQTTDVGATRGPALCPFITNSCKSIRAHVQFVSRRRSNGQAMFDGITALWAELPPADKAAWLSAMATVVAAFAALASLGLGALLWKLTRDANRWQRFERRTASTLGDP